LKILALEIEKPGLSGADFAPYLQAEAARAWELNQSGMVRELYFRADQHTAVLVLECAGVEEARQALATLPLVQAELIDFEIIPLVAYPGFARLFSDPKLVKT
jgi:muconolactone delta-isomerase